MRTLYLCVKQLQEFLSHVLSETNAINSKHNEIKSYFMLVCFNVMTDASLLSDRCTLTKPFAL